MRRVSSPTLTSFPKDRIKVLLLENIHPSAHEIFRSETFHLETLPGALAEDELAARIEDVHVLGIRSKTRVTDRVLGSARRLLSVGCFCIGTNQVDLAGANRRGIVRSPDAAVVPPRTREGLRHRGARPPSQLPAALSGSL